LGKSRGTYSLKLYKTTMIVTFLVLISLALFASTTYGITGNFTSDSTPYTGVVVLFSDAARQQPIGFCSGFLLSPTVMVTAGHSLVNAAAVSVCFDKGPITYAIEDGKIVYNGASAIYNGAAVAYPGYVPAMSGNQEFSTSDIGIIILDQPVSGVTVFPTLPIAGFADTLPAKTNLQVVGYGYQYQINPRNDGVMNSWTGTLSCNSAVAQLSPANFVGNDKYLKLTANPSQGKGGVAFGDSGGPVLLKGNDNAQDTVIAVNSFVSNANFAGITYHARLDQQDILSWISGFLN
jgi:hypothetical protein